MNNYKGYEIFSEPAYFDMVCIRKTGSKNFNETIHVDLLTICQELFEAHFPPCIVGC